MTHGKSPYPNVESSKVYEMLESGYRLECPDDCPEQVYLMMRKCKYMKINSSTHCLL